MKQVLRNGILQIARIWPSTAKKLLQYWIRSHQQSISKPRYLLIDLANELDIRAEIDATLVNGMSIRVVANDVVGSSIVYDGFFEPETVPFYEKVLKPGSVFLDVGSQVGQYTLLAAGLVRPHGRVYAFEPDPKTLQLLNYSIKSNHLEDIAHTIHGAASNKNGTVDLYLSETKNIGANSLRPPAQGLSTGVSVPVKSYSLDTFVSENGLERVDLIKIDVEGAELLVLEGAEKLLRRADAPVLIVEFCDITLQQFGSDCNDLAKSLQELNYDLYYVGDLPLKPYKGPHPEGRAINVAAIPKHAKQSLSRYLASVI